MRNGLLFALSFLLILVTGFQHHHGKAHAGAHGVDRRAVKVETVTVTEIEAVTITVNADVLTASSSSVSAVTFTNGHVYCLKANILRQTDCFQPASAESQYSAKPTELVTEQGGNPFPTLVAVANSAILKNSCEYPVYLWSAGHESCEGPAAEGKLLAANSTHIEKLRECAQGGISLKVSKNNSAAQPMQFEYTVWPDHQMVSYDISYLNCMRNTDGEKDLSDCAGHDGGIQAVGGSDCPDYHCLAGQWCDKNAYVVAEFGYLPGAPVGGCTKEKGIAFELCAGVHV
jgi:hypothetical protein